MAARAVTVAGRRVAGRTGPPLLASCRDGANMNHNSASAQREDEQYKDVRAARAAPTGAQVEAALNRKNVEVLHGKEHLATVLPDRHDTIAGGALDGDEDASWVPDQDTGVFRPADAGTHGPPPHLHGGTASASVLDQAVFVREEDMEDVERPAVDIPNANTSGSSNNY